MPYDERGLLTTAANPEAVEAFDRTLAEYARFGRETGNHLKDALKADPEMVMAHCLRGYFFHLMGTRTLVGRAHKALAEAEAHAAAATPREQHHVAALRAWCAGDLGAATREWEAILADHPRDFLALKLPHYTLFYTGQSEALRASVERALPAWDETVPGYGYVLGMHAFALEETGAYEQAERAGREAVEGNPFDGWAVHAVSHVMEMQDRSREGVTWIREHESEWNQANNFRFHLWWHRALMHLDLGEYDEVLRLYDEDVFEPTSDDYLDLANDASLLLRLEIAGVEVGDRWEPIAEKARGRVTDHVLGFADAHFAMALAGAGDLDAVRQQVESMRRFGADHPGDTEAPVLQEVVVPLAEALSAYSEQNFAQAADDIARIRDQVIRLGGSHAQRDVFEMLLIDSALKGERLELAREVLSERIAHQPGNPWSWECYAEALQSLDGAGAAAARQRATELRLGAP